MAKRVFLSSTCLDLEDLRSGIKEALEGLGILSSAFCVTRPKPRSRPECAPLNQASDVTVYNDTVDSFKSMEPKLDQERQQAHALLDMLPAEKLKAVRSLLEVMVEPLGRSLALAPVEEEEITPETAAALGRARASLARGEGIPHEEIRREFGLSR